MRPRRYYLYYCACGNKGRGIGLITSKPVRRNRLHGNGCEKGKTAALHEDNHERTLCVQSGHLGLRKIRRLVEMMKEHDLTGLISSKATCGLASPGVRRAANGDGRADGWPGAGGGSVASRQPRPPGPRVAAPEEFAGKPKGVLLIRSPMVGTFYAAADPDSPPYVKVGDHVGRKPPSASSRP